MLQITGSVGDPVILGRERDVVYQFRLAPESTLPPCRFRKLGPNHHTYDIEPRISSD
jgi:hypothetical protein